MAIAYIIIGIAVGIAVGYLAAIGKGRAAQAQAQLLDKQCAETKRSYEQQITTLKEEQQQALTALKEQCNEQMTQQLALLREQFTTATEREMKKRGEDLSALNVQKMTELLAPLTVRLAQMREAVEKNEKTQTEATTRLESALRQTYTQAEALGKTTNSLVSALTSDNKYQGDFGEMQLRQLLESMGFIRGVHFEEQVLTRDAYGESVHDTTTGSRKQPDVVLHYPDKRDIIIDAKTSTTAFLRYHDTSLSEMEHQQALKDHLTAVRTQVKNLSKKDYWRDYNKQGIQLDFVVMFIPIEGAMQLAVSEEPQLWEEAFQQGVFITGPQNLYALLRMIEMSWKQVAQVENQQQIIACADEMVRRVQIFYERFMKAQASLDKTQEAFGEVVKSLSPTGQSIITTANKLLKYGAREDKSSGRKALPQGDDTLPLGD